MAAALFCAIPILDITTVFVARPRHGRRIMSGGKDHLSHRLAARGLSMGRAVLVLIAAQAALVGLASLVAVRTVSAITATVAAGLLVSVEAWFAWTVSVYDATSTVEPDARRRIALHEPAAKVTS